MEHGIFGLALYVWLMWEIFGLVADGFPGPNAMAC